MLTAVLKIEFSVSKSHYSYLLLCNRFNVAQLPYMYDKVIHSQQKMGWYNKL